jgi:hypothetical protein
MGCTAYLPGEGEIEAVVYRNKDDQYADGKNCLDKTCTKFVQSRAILSRISKARPG